MTSFMRTLFPNKRRKTDSITTSLIVESSSASAGSLFPTSSSSIALSSIIKESNNGSTSPTPSTSAIGNHRRQHSTGGVSMTSSSSTNSGAHHNNKLGLPPPGPSRNGTRRKESNNNHSGAPNSPSCSMPLSDLCTQSTVTLRKEDLRMILIESESRVLYDTLTVIPLKKDSTETSSNGKNVSNCKEFQFLRRRKDIRHLSQLLFGAVPTANGSESFKIHILEDDDKILVSKSFFVARQNQKEMGSSDSDSQSTLKSFDGWQPRTHFTRSTTSTPETFNRIRHISITLGDDDGDLNCGASSSLNIPRAFSPPHRLSRNRRRQMAVKTSLSETTAYAIPSSLKSRSRLSSIGSQTDDEQHTTVGSRHVALGLLFPASQRFFLFQHMPLIEAEMSRFESRIATCAGHPPTFLHNVSRAWDELAETICTLHNAPRLRNPVWLTLNERREWDKCVAVQFCHQLSYLVKKYDIKETGYFISNLVTAILMHHMSWVASVASPPVRNDPRLRETVSMRNSIFGMIPNDEAPSLGYNAHMAQYLELSGNCGPHRSAKAVICGDDVELLTTICQVLSFFIRCSAIQHVDDDKCWELPIEQAFSPINVCASSEASDSAAASPPVIHLAFSPGDEVEEIEIEVEDHDIEDDLLASRRSRTKSRKIRANHNNNNFNELTLVESPTSSMESLPSVVARTAIVVETDQSSSITIIDRLEYPCCGSHTDDEDDDPAELWTPRPSSDGLGRSLFAGPLTTYCPHFVVSAILKNQVNMPDTISKMFDEVRCTDSPCHRSAAGASISSSQSSSSVCYDVQMPENVLIMADVTDWTVKIISSEGFDEVTSPSEAVVSMFEQFVDLHSAAPKNPEFLVSVIEDSLAHIVGKSLTLVEMVARDGATTELTPERVKTIVGCDHSDLRLIVNVAAVYWPPVLSSVFG